MRFNKTIIALSICSALNSANALAEEASEEDKEIETISIIGKLLGKGEARANVIIDASDIADAPSGIGVTKLLDRVSGIQVGSSDPLGGGGFDSTVNMRGFGKDQIGFSIDGIPNGRTTLGGGAVPNRFLDTANLSGIDVSQSAGVVGTPSRQALVGHINYSTADPYDEKTVNVDLSFGSRDYRRSYIRLDSGEITEGLTSYLSYSRQDYDVWIGEGVGDQTRTHIDFKMVYELDNGGTVKFRNSYNDRDGVGYNIVSYLQTPCADEPNICFFDQFAPSNPAFTIDSKQDGYTDFLTGDPTLDRSYRPTRGNDRQDNLTYFEVDIPLSDEIDFEFKPYYHFQNGIGRFANHRDEGAVPDTIAGEDDPILYFRENDYDMSRYGVVFEFKGEHNDLLNWTAGLWYEDSNRTQVRDWYDFNHFTSGTVSQSNSYHTSEDKEWDNKVTLFYLSNKTVLLDEKLTLEYGFSYLDNKVDYNAPIQDSGEDLYNVSSYFNENSGISPKIGVLYAVNENLEFFGGFAHNVASITDGVMEDIGDDSSSNDNVEIDVDLDEADLFDLGLRYTGDSIGFGIQAFQIESKEFTPIDSANSLASTTVSQGKKVQGIEFTFNKQWEKFDLYATYTNQSHEYNNEDHVPFTVNGSDVVGIPTDNAFVELTWRPIENFKIALNAKYTSRRAGFYADPSASSGLTSSFDFVNQGLVDAGIRTQDELDSVTSSSESLPSYTVIGLDANYIVDLNDNMLESLIFKVNVTNLTNEEHISGVAPELLGVDRKWAGRYFIGAPRAVIFSVNATF